MITNDQIAQIFDKMAALIEFRWEQDPADPFRVRAYRKAANIIRWYPHNIYQLWKSGQLKPIPGLWEKTRQKLLQFLETWTIKKYEELKKWIPESVLELMEVPGIWPKLAKQLYQTLWIDSVEKLKETLEKAPHKILSLPRMGEWKLEQIKKWLEMYQFTKTRTPIGIAYPYILNLVEQIRSFEEVEKAEIAGSTRRMKETIWDIDILAVSKDPLKTMDKFVKLENVETIIAKWATKTSVFLSQPHIQVDLRIIPSEDWWAALQYFTGSKNHNIHLRTIAKEKGYKISEYWIFKIENEKEIKVWWEKEEDIYNILWMDRIPPELREDRWEIEAALNHNLPNLVDYNDLKWDLHMHSTRSDWQNSIEELIQTAISLGYEYIAITDHSKSLAIANGLDEERFLERLKEIKHLQEKYKNKIKILVWTECDILADWKLDYDDEILKLCDIVIASIHLGFKGDQTARILKALDNPYVTILWHPTNRIFWEREPIQADRDLIFKKAIEKWIAMEVNCQPLRLDLNDILIRKYISMWWKIAINTDAHSIKHMIEYPRYGIWQARRWWAEKKDVINTYSRNEFKNFLKRKST